MELSHTTTWRNIENIRPNERDQTAKKVGGKAGVCGVDTELKSVQMHVVKGGSG